MRTETGPAAFPHFFWCLDGKGTLGVVATLALLLVAIVAAELSMHHVGVTARRMQHTHDVLRAGDNLHAVLLDAESDYRGFLLSGDRAYLDACATALPRAQTAMGQLRALTANETAQQQRLDALEPLLDQRLAVFRESIKPTRGEVRPAIEQPLNDKNRTLLHHLHELLTAIRDDELALLADQSARSEAAQWWLGLTTTLANVLALAAAIGAVVLLNRGAAHRRAAEESLRRREEADRLREHEELRRSHGELATALLQSQEARQAADELVRGIFQAAPLALVALDRQARVRLWNPAAQRAFGWAPAEIHGQAYPLVPPGKEAEFQELLGRALGGESLLDIETQRLGKAGQIVEVAISAAPLGNASGEVTGVLVVLADITERKALQAEFRRAQKLEAVGRLAGSIAHDFNNLLTAINGCCGLLLLKLPPTDPTRELLEEVLRAAERATGLTRQLLAFGRRQHLQPAWLDLNSVVAGMGTLLFRLIGEDVALATDLDPQLGAVHADRGQLEQVIMNLALNSRDAMPQGGTLTVTTRMVARRETEASDHGDIMPGPQVLLTVSDTGVGMDEATRARIFEPYFTTKELGHGTGLGLATVYGIVTQSGGSIEVESWVGRGTIFMVYLPCKPVLAVPSVTPPLTGVAASSTAHGGETVLVVEDEPIIRGLIRTILEKRGYTVLAAVDGIEALRIAESHVEPLHLLIADVVMPRMSGRAVAEHLQELRPDLKVLYLSGYGCDATLRHGVEHGSAAFLQKPFTPDTLADKVRAILDAPCVT